MPTKLEKTSLSGQVYILARLVKYLVKCSYYTMSFGHDTLRGDVHGSGRILSRFA